MNNRENVIKQAIIQQILKWKLSTAEVQLQKDGSALSAETRGELESLLEQYRGYDKIMFSAQENCDKNPATARMMMNRVPYDILITHPSYRKINARLQKNDDDSRAKSALKKCQDAERSVLTALQRRYMIIKEEQNA